MEVYAADGFVIVSLIRILKTDLYVLFDSLKNLFNGNGLAIVISLNF